ncbi:MAG: helix-turn-helix domain-containing protein [Gemmatimonadaceae bacterium]
MTEVLRLRLPELLTEHKPPLTAYGLVKASDGRISLSTAYRLVRQRGAVKYFDAQLLEALSDILGLEPGDLIERTQEPKRKRSA